MKLETLKRLNEATSFSKEEIATVENVIKKFDYMLTKSEKKDLDHHLKFIQGKMGGVGDRMTNDRAKAIVNILKRVK